MTINQEYFLRETVNVPSYELPGRVIGTLEPDRRPPVEGEERMGYRYLVEIHLPPKLRWFSADELEPADEGGGLPFGPLPIPANIP